MPPIHSSTATILFEETSNSMRPFKPLNQLGISSKRLLYIFNQVSLTNRPKLLGTSRMLLVEMLRLIRDCMFEMRSGMDSISLNEQSSSSSRVNSVITSGKFRNPHVLMFRYMRLWHLTMLAGRSISPSLCETSRYSSPYMFPMLLGRDVKLLYDKVSLRRLARAVMDSGNSVNLL